MVDNCSLQTVSVERAGICLSAVAVLGRFRCGFGVFNALRRFQHAFSMAVNHLLGIIRATVANFHGTQVEDFSKFAIFRKVYLPGLEI